MEQMLQGRKRSGSRRIPWLKDCKGDSPTSNMINENKTSKILGYPDDVIGRKKFDVDSFSSRWPNYLSDKCLPIYVTVLAVTDKHRCEFCSSCNPWTFANPLSYILFIK
uniref:Uncharacterized protein n=1 Tax=Megaselia scalaris TaxID=36166 RepID=T1GGZ7_MEGSC